MTGETLNITLTTNTTDGPGGPDVECLLTVGVPGEPADTWQYVQRAAGGHSLVPHANPAGRPGPDAGRLHAVLAAFHAMHRAAFPDAHAPADAVADRRHQELLDKFQLLQHAVVQAANHTVKQLYRPPARAGV